MSEVLPVTCSACGYVTEVLHYSDNKTPVIPTCLKCGGWIGPSQEERLASIEASTRRLRERLR